LGDTHPAKAQAQRGEGSQVLVCAEMRCSLPITSPVDLVETAAEMLRQ
jgi:hypothetical protein